MAPITRTTKTSLMGRLFLTLALALVVLMLAVSAASAAGKPGKPSGKNPWARDTITATKTTFIWTKAARAAKYEVRVYQGGKLVVRKAGLRSTQWKSGKTLPTDVDLTWKVRASNAAGSGAWSKSVPFKIAVAPVYKVGDAQLGGKIAYVLSPADKGYDPNIQHGLVAAATDQSGTDSHWTLVRTMESTGAAGTAVGTGKANTDTIIAKQGTTDMYAARIARSYTGGGFTDWYLPSKDELNILHKNMALIGGFQKATYWSSSHYDGPTVWVQFFDEGGAQNHQWREMRGTVRAVRSF
jgi:hypothetical protein